MNGPSSGSGRVVAVVVAWNRRDLLLRCLDGLAAQERRPDAVVVVDNASTDDSAAAARSHPVVTEVVTLPVNTGGAGGFAAGIARAASTHDASRVWVMDDDTVPTPTALAELLDAVARFGGDVAVAASRADWTDGREHPMNTPRRRVGLPRRHHARADAVGARQIRSASFVSILIDAAAVWDAGLPRAAYFLWNDDFEYTARLLRRRFGLYVPASRVHHLTKTFGASDADPGPRFYNEVRNKVWLFTRSEALAPWEKLLYGASTLRRWARTLARSADRRALWGHARRGLRDGLRTPASTVSLLAGTPVDLDVRVVEAGAGRG